MPIDRLRDGQRGYAAAVAGDGRVAVLIERIFVDRHVDDVRAAGIEITRVDRREVAAEDARGIAGAGRNQNIVLKMAHGADGAVVSVPNIQRFAIGLIKAAEGNVGRAADLGIHPGGDADAQVRQFRLRMRDGLIVALGADLGKAAARNDRQLRDRSRDVHTHGQREIRADREAALGEIPDHAKAAGGRILDAGAEARVVAECDGAVNGNSGGDRDGAEEAHGDRAELNGIRQAGGRHGKRNRTGRRRIAAHRHIGIYVIAAPGANVVFTDDTLHVAGNSHTADRSAQMNGLDRLFSIQGRHQIRRFGVVAENIGDLCAFVRLHLCEVALHDALCIDAHEDRVDVDLLARHRQLFAVVGDAAGLECAREILHEDDKGVPLLEGHGRVRNDDRSVVRDLGRDTRRHDNNAVREDVLAVIARLHRVALAHLGRVGEHVGRFRARHGLLRQELSTGQLEPAAVDRHLHVFGIRDCIFVRIGVRYALVKLEAQTEVERVRRKFTCRRLVRLERAARLEVDHAELHCDHQVLIVACAAVDVAVVIVRIVVRFDGHVEGFDQLLHPRNARDRLIRRQRRGWQDRHDHQHREHKAQKSFSHVFPPCSFFLLSLVYSPAGAVKVTCAAHTNIPGQPAKLLS